MKGRMPNCGPVVALVGAHTLPKRNLVSPISRMAGRPEITRYTLMHSTKPTATMPHSRKIRWMACSMALRVRRLLPAVRFIEFSFPNDGEAPSPAAAGEGPRFVLLGGRHGARILDEGGGVLGGSEVEEGLRRRGQGRAVLGHQHEGPLNGVAAVQYGGLGAGHAAYGDGLHGILTLHSGEGA